MNKSDVMNFWKSTAVGLKRVESVERLINIDVNIIENINFFNCSIGDVWKNVLTNMSDFKELIPEFYDLSLKGDFLSNMYAVSYTHLTLPTIYSV